jgi:hypothetical protein
MIQAGNRYTYEGYSVIAIEVRFARRCRCCRINPHRPGGLDRLIYVDADRLTPEPMKYHAGAVPGAPA